MGGDEGGAPLPAHQRQELGEDDVRGGFVEVAGRLVGEDEERAVGERAGDGDPLLLAPGELGRPVREPLAESEGREQLGRAAAGVLGGGAADQLGNDDVLRRREIRQQMMELVDEAQRVAAQPGAAVIVEAGRFLAMDADRAFEAAFEETDRLEQGRLARARRAEQRDDLARVDVEVDAAQHVDGDSALLEAAPEAADGEDGLTHI